MTVRVVAPRQAELPVPFARPEILPEAVRAASGILRSGRMATGPVTAAFEQQVATLVGAAHGVGTSSGSAAIELAVRALDLAPGSRVLVPTMSFCGAAHAVLHAGLTPVLVDVDPATGMPDVEATERAASEGAEAMLVVHLGGMPAPVHALAAAAGLPLDRVVEDAAHALGTWLGDDPVGSISWATCFSFYATKNLPIGEGGMVTTDDRDLAARLRRTRLHAMSSDPWDYRPGGSWLYTVEEAGLKANMSDVQAAIGREQLRAFARWQRRREEIAARYAAELADLPGIELPHAPATGRHAWHLYAVRVGPESGLDRDVLAGVLSEHAIGTSVHFVPLHHMPYFRRTCVLPPGGLPGADALFPRLLSLPIYPALEDRAVDRVCGIVRDAVVQARRDARPLSSSDAAASGDTAAGRAARVPHARQEQRGTAP